MPCDIGYKEVARVVIRKAERTVTAPKIDNELLAKLGEESLTFLTWLRELNIVPLAAEALKRTLRSVKSTGDVECIIDTDGNLQMRGSFGSDKGSRQLQENFRAIEKRYQFEILGIIAELLDYEVQITVAPDGTYCLRGEKQENAKVHKYLEINETGRGTEMRFEHFSSAEELEQEQIKFLALSAHFGRPIQLREVTAKSGSPIRVGTEHRHFIRLRH